jgi:hypothetical protein
MRFLCAQRPVEPEKLVKKLTVFRLIDYLASELFFSTASKGLLKVMEYKVMSIPPALRAGGGGTRIICS